MPDWAWLLAGAVIGFFMGMFFALWISNSND